MTRLTSDLSAGDTGRIEQYNDMRTEAKASSYLLAFEQATPDLTLKVSPGQIYFGSTLVEFAGGNSPSFTAPTTNPRIDILSINDSGTLVRTAGTEGATPTAPDVPAGEIPIKQIRNRVGQTSIKDTDDGTNGYIEKDLRPFVGISGVPIVRLYTSGSTWTKPTGLKHIEVEVVGGGGAGGGSSDVSGSAGRGGGAGGYSKKLIPAGSLGATETVTVGSGGTGVSNADGNSGNTSSFGSHCQGTGGGGGEHDASSGNVSGSGGSGSGGDVNISGNPGESGIGVADFATNGGASVLGAGGKAMWSANGEAGGYGAGGGGSSRGSSGTDRRGGNGGTGVVIVKEYY